MKKNLVTSVIIFFIGLIFFPMAVQAENSNLTDWNIAPELSGKAPDRAYGTTFSGIHSINAKQFITSDASQATDIKPVGYNIYCTPGCIINANVSLTSGVKISQFEIEGYDNDLGKLNFYLLSCPVGELGCNIIAQAETSGTPGFTTVISTPTASHTVDNLNNSYLVEGLILGGSSNVSLGSVRIYYNRQISTPPSTATFSDVPTDHWAFQYIEALVSTGVVTGKPDELFHPSDPITRAEMSKLIAQLLGVHWTN